MKKKYLVVTHIQGLQNKVQPNGSYYPYFKEEREYFDTKEEVNEYVTLFEQVAESYDKPKKEYASKYNRDIYTWKFEDPSQRLCGYLIADTEKEVVLQWWGDLVGLNKKMNKLVIKDKLFRGEDEIPKNYKWDTGEYEGWLRFRWGDGKNAVDYVDNIKQKVINKNSDKTEHIDDIEEEENWEAYTDYTPNDEFGDKLMEAFDELEEREKIKRLENRW